MKIYTRTGDKGETSFIGGRISKASNLMELIGTLDELNAVIGLALSHIEKENKKSGELGSYLQHNQNVIFNCGALVADVNGELDNSNMDLKSEVSRLEKEIDATDAKLPVLQNFILPGGSPGSAYLHLARTVCRRAERNLVNLTESIKKTTPEYRNSLVSVGKYLNRLSDWLFVYARWVNNQLEISDQEWNKLG